ncbi:MAG: hypothetical protein RLY86_148 [Pseudomonadota bacterium]|jgi:hypothetical protein
MSGRRPTSFEALRKQQGLTEQDLRGLHVTLRYVDGAGKATERPVTLLEYELKGAKPALFAKCHMRRAGRSFLVDRIAEVIDDDGETIDIRVLLALFGVDVPPPVLQAQRTRIAPPQPDRQVVPQGRNKPDRAAVRAMLKAAARRRTPYVPGADQQPTPTATPVAAAEPSPAQPPEPAAADQQSAPIRQDMPKWFGWLATTLLLSLIAGLLDGRAAAASVMLIILMIFTVIGLVRPGPVGMPSRGRVGLVAIIGFALAVIVGPGPSGDAAQDQQEPVAASSLPETRPGPSAADPAQTPAQAPQRQVWPLSPDKVAAGILTLIEPAVGQPDNLATLYCEYVRRREATRSRILRSLPGFVHEALVPGDQLTLTHELAVVNGFEREDIAGGFRVQPGQSIKILESLRDSQGRLHYRVEFVLIDGYVQAVQLQREFSVDDLRAYQAAIRAGEEAAVAQIEAETAAAAGHPLPELTAMAREAGWSAACRR